jgi:Tfp pilus assembly protein PilN
MPKMSGRLALVLSIVAVIVVLLIGWFVLISPQKSKASNLDTQIGAAELQLADAQKLLAAPNKAQTAAALRAANRALPDTPETSALLRQLSAMVAASKTELDSVGPGAVPTTGGAQPYPLSLTMKGRYFALQKFIRLLQASSGVKNGKITGKGRLYSIDSISFGGGGAAPGQSKGPLTANIALNAYVYGTAPPPTPSTTTTSDTTTTATGTTG